MPKYVILRNDERESGCTFVASSQTIERTGHSYTRMLQYARTFDSKDEAMGDCCGNELILSVDAIMEAWQ